MSSPRSNPSTAFVHRAQQVDLPRYMGSWFILGAIGLGLEKGAHDPVETYTMNPDGTIATVFQFRQDRFDGELKTKVTRAWAGKHGHKAEWKVRTFWPLRQQYVIAHLETDYSAAIVARDKRDYVWILSRTPQLRERHYQTYLMKIADMGYDVDRMVRYPQNGQLPDQAPSDALPSGLRRKAAVAAATTDRVLLPVIEAPRRTA